MDLKDNVTKVVLALIVGFCSWLSFTVSTTKSTIHLLENNFQQVYENEKELKKRSLFMTNSQLIDQNHELRITILEKPRNNKLSL